MTAGGFTFSTPSIKVKLSQEAVTPAPSATPTATPVPATKPIDAKKTVIVCMKGKVVKKVTAIKPKCPTGYKKK
jgi:hypothetical protein